MTRAHRAMAGAVRTGAVVLAIAAIVLGISASRAAAFDPVKKVCGVAGLLSTLAGKACDVLQGGRLAKAGKRLLGGNLSGAGKALISGGATRLAGGTLGLAAVGAWVLGGAKAALHETAKEIGRTTSPRLGSTWFSSTYWRVAGIGALLTLPFLFAAAIQALLRSDLSLLAHAAFGYLPLALLAVSIAAPLTMLVLAACDEMCTIVSSASGGAGVSFLRTFGGIMGGLSVLDGSPFLAVLVGVLLVGAALAISLELLVREAAVYVVVLMLPLAFAGMVWPARRIWAVRALETLLALILAKFAIVAVLALAGGALAGVGPTRLLAGTALVLLAAFSPWVVVRLLPFAELAAGASGALRGEGSRLDGQARTADGLSGAIELWASSMNGMRDDAEHSAAEDHAAEQALGQGRARESAHDGSGRRQLSEAGDAAMPDRGGSGAAGDEHPSSAPTAPEGPARQRIPGMPAMWQAENNTWRPLSLPLTDWPTSTLWPPDQRGDADDADTKEEHEPLPPSQDPGDGRL